jgi:cephalosporin hydroxylase
MSKRISMIQSFSIARDVVDEVWAEVANKQGELVCLDGNHTYSHVLAEAKAYPTLTSSGSHCVVFDITVEDMPRKMFLDRNWAPGNSSKTFASECLKTNPRYEIDIRIDFRLLKRVTPNGYLKRVR